MGGAQSSEHVNALIRFLTPGMEPSIPDFVGGRQTWVSAHNNIVTGDTNGVADLFIWGTHTALPLPVIDWIEDDPLRPSTDAVIEGGVTPDGHYAFWVTTQKYESPYGAAGRENLYRRRIEPTLTFNLTVNVVGNGTVERTPEGTPNGGTYEYADTDRVTQRATPATGWVFAGWQGVDSRSGNTARVTMYHSRQVTATFVRSQPPTSVSASITTDEDTASSGVAPGIVDPDAEDAHTITIVGPRHGSGGEQPRSYTPDADFSSSESFTIQATNRSGLSRVGTVSVTVNPVNDPPTVAPLSITTNQGQPSAPPAPDISDLDPGESFSLSVSVPPAYGTVNIVVQGEMQRFVYTPQAGFSGINTFTFLVQDASGATAIGQTAVTVSAMATPTPTTDEYARPQLAGIALSAFCDPIKEECHEQDAMNSQRTFVADLGHGEGRDLSGRGADGPSRAARCAGGGVVASFPGGTAVSRRPGSLPAPRHPKAAGPADRISPFRPGPAPEGGSACRRPAPGPAGRPDHCRAPDGPAPAGGAGRFAICF